MVTELKENFQTFRNISFASGISLKTVHNWCALPKKKEHKAKALADLRKKEFENFLLQDQISYEHPSKKFSGKRFLRDTLDITRKKYLADTQYHKNGIISLSTMKAYRPEYIMLCGQTPLDQCLCDKCENCEQILKTFLALGMKEIPANRYAAVDVVVCAERNVQHGSGFGFPKLECIRGDCADCGENVLREKIQNANTQVFSDNKNISWREWYTPEGKKAPQKCQVKGSMKQALDKLLQIIKYLKAHLFSANWNRNIY